MATSPIHLDPPPGRLSLKVYGPEQGLANPVVWSMAQDGRGFLWFGTEDGLFRYDGAKFHGWTLKDGLPASLVEHLSFDHQGRLWVGTYSGLASRDDKGIKAYGPEQGLPFTRITGLGVEPNGRLWVATSDGLFWRTETGTFQAVPGWPSGAPVAMAVSAVYPQVWVSYSGEGRHGLRRWQNGQWQEFFMDPPTSNAIESLVITQDGTVWAQSLSLLWFKSVQALGFEAYSPALPSINQKPFLYIDPKGLLWAPTSKGISTIFEGRREDLSEKEGFPTSVIHAMFMDQEGSLWLGGNNLHRLLGGGIFRHYLTSHGLPSDTVWISLRDSLGRLVVGTDAGLAVATASGFAVVAGSEGFQVRSAILGPDNAIYATGHPALLRWDPVRGVMKRFAAESGFRPEGRVFRLRFGSDGCLWIATESTGLIRAVFKDGVPRFEQESVVGGGKRERFTDIWFDGQNRLWATGSNGLAVKENGVWRRFTSKDGLKIDQTAFVRSRSDDTILLAYFGAPSLTQISYEHGNFRVLRHYDDVFPPDKVIYFFGEDARGGLWLGTGQGLYLLLADGRVEHFTRNDGLASENASNMSFFAEPDGVVWFGTTGGLHRFDPQLYKGSSEPPATSILEVRYGQTTIQGEALRSNTIPAKDSTVELVFAAPSSIREGAVQYQARLVGFENEWHASPNREERYPRLPAGKYTFEARARIASGDYGPIATWSFEILPTWFQSAWFKSFLVVVFLALMVLLIRWRLGALRRRNLTLQRMVSVRTEELNQANELLRSQSLTDPLTGLRNRRYLSVCMTEDVAQVCRTHRSLVMGQEERVKQNIDLIFLMVDVDHFKSVNDRYGHACGDMVLKQVAEVIRDKTRDTDTVVRWGGEEFLIVARNSARLDSHLLADRVKSGIENHHFDLGDGSTIRKTCSIGFSFFPLISENVDLVNWEKSVDLADQCLYVAKRSGRNAWVGLYMSMTGDKEAIKKGIDQNVEHLISEGHLEVKSSLMVGTRLVWKPTDKQGK